MRRGALLGLALLLVGLFAVLSGGTEPASAQAPATPVLVSNLGQPYDILYAGALNLDRAQSFTTGGNAAGYTLDGIDWEFRGIIDQSALPILGAGMTVTIRSDYNGEPGTVLGTLTNPQFQQTGSTPVEATFTAPGSGIQLQPDSRYWVVLDVTTSLFVTAIAYTASDGEDSGAADGFSIGDDSRTRSWQSGGGWSSIAQSLKTRINGSPNQALVGNLGQADGGTGNLSFDHAQSFTTGGNSGGYALASIDWEFVRIINPALLDLTITVSIREDANGAPGTEDVGVLTNPTFQAITTDQVFRFTAPGGVRLKPDTRYWVVMDSIRSFTSYTIRNTASDGEDAGGTAGFSIGDTSLYRDWQVSGWTTFNQSKKIRLNGLAVPLPQNHDGSFTVPDDWALKPAGLSVGDRFRLLFRTTSRWSAEDPHIETYDARVQGEITGGDLDSIKPFAQYFKVVGSSSTGSPTATDARTHLGFRQDNAWVEGVPVYWMDDEGEGALVADDYQDFCDREQPDSPVEEPEYWWQNDLLTDFRNEDGAPHGDDDWPWTGTSNDCTRSGGSAFGAQTVERGAHSYVNAADRDTNTGPRSHGPLSNGRVHRGQSHSLFGMSPVFVVGGEPVEVSFTLDTDATNLSRGTGFYGYETTGIVEGWPLVYTLTASPAPRHDLDVTVRVNEGGGDWGAPTEPFTVTVPAGQTTVNFSVPTANDYQDELSGAVFVMIQPGAYRLAPPWAVRVEIFDDDELDCTVGVQTTQHNCLIYAASGKVISTVTVVNKTADTYTLAPEIDPATVFTDQRLVDRHRGAGLDAPEFLKYRAFTSNTHLTQRRNDPGVDGASGDPLIAAVYTSQDGVDFVEAGQTIKEALGVRTHDPNKLVDHDRILITGEYTLDGDGNVISVANSRAMLSFVDGLLCSPDQWDLDYDHFGWFWGHYPGVPGSASATRACVQVEFTVEVTYTDGDGDNFRVRLKDNQNGATSVYGWDDETGDQPTDDGAASSCVTADQALLSQVEAKVAEHGNSGRADLKEMFTRTRDTLKGTDDYTTADVRARPDKQGAEWQANGPNALWQSIYAELDALESCRATEQAEPEPTPEISIAGGNGITEGGDAQFTVTASPPPGADLAVSVTVSATGDYGVTTGTQSVTIPTTGSATLTVGTDDDDADEADGSVTATVDSGTGYTVSSSQGAATVAVADDDAPVDDTPTDDATATCVTTDSALLSQVEGKVAEHQDSGRADLKEMFSRSHNTMQGNDDYTTADIRARPDKQGAVWQADGPNALWQSIYAELDALESCRATSEGDTDPQQQDPPPPTPEVSVSGGNDVTEGGDASFTLTANPAPGADLAVTVNVTVSASGDYGVTTGTQSVTIPASGSATFTVSTTDDAVDEADGSVTVTVNSGTGYDVSSSASSATVAVADDDDPQQQEPPPPTPEISIAGGNGVTEGGDAVFTLTASPAPDAPLAVTVTVAASGDYGVTTGTQSVTIPASGSATFTVSTTDDTVDETDGSVTVTLNSGTGYDVSSSASSATVAVSDDDVPEISITAGSGVTEGGTASFTLTANPVPASGLTVSVTVSASGDYGVTTGTQSVTIPTSGSATFMVSTTGDAVDEADGSVTVTLNGGTGYTVSSSASSAKVTVSDDDDPPARNEEPEAPASASVSVSSITTDESIVNLGGKDTVIEFTVTLSEPAPEGGVAVGFRGDAAGWIANPNMDYSIKTSESVVDNNANDDGSRGFFGYLDGTLTIGAGETQGTIQVIVYKTAYIPGRSVLLNLGVTTVDGEALDAPPTTTVVVRK